jgi:hypothetical protein
LSQLQAAVREAPGLAAKLESSSNLWQLFRSTMETPSPADSSQTARRVFRISEDLLSRTDAMVEACVALPTTKEYPVTRTLRSN